MAIALRDVTALLTGNYCLDCGRARLCACQEQDVDKEKLLTAAILRCPDALRVAQVFGTWSLRVAFRLLNESKWIGYALPTGFMDRVQHIYNVTRTGGREERDVRRLRTAEQVRSSACVCPSVNVLLQACRVAGSGTPLSRQPPDATAALWR